MLAEQGQHLSTINCAAAEGVSTTVVIVDIALEEGSWGEETISINK